MLPSQGRATTGDPKPTADRNPRPRPTSSTVPHPQASFASSQSQFTDNVNSTNPWFLPPSTNVVSQSGSSKTVHPAAPSSVTASSLMIGPTSTFYDPEALAQGQGQGDSQSQYQQWIDASYGGQHQQHQHQQQSMHQQPTHHQQRVAAYQPPQQQQAYQQDPQQVARVSNQYSYSQNQYAQATHYTDSSAGMTTQTNVGGRTAHPSDNAYHIQPTSDSYAGYYSHANTGVGTNTSDPNTNHPVPYATASETLYHQQQQLQHQIQPQSAQSHGQSDHHSHSHSQSRPQSQTQIQHHTTPPGAASYASELLSISSQSNPHSTKSSSLSPASNSWTDEVYPSANLNNNVNANINRADVSSVSKPMAKMPTSSSTSKHLGSKPRKHAQPQPGTSPTAARTASPADSAPKASAKRKRPNPGAPMPQKLYRIQDDESPSGSDAEDGYDGGLTFGGGISVGMGGLGVENSLGPRTGRL
ncbi:hypothetical protein D9615_008667 [Tricholomella constricta]|uniref:Uncharacterized protein n=1 Tax=Tricholomella constricta TaxID=117010 RepID=A0A8H5M0V0_9AGAR|nr:hypothetical protein D9615_008667 [Tricholomella constricta]